MAVRSSGANLARVALSAFLAAGLLIAVYLAWHHDNRLYGDASAKLANCPHTETVDCDLVNTSRWSEIWGIPIAAYAIPTYLLVLGLIWSGGRRSRSLAYVFSIGLLTTAASALLFYVSKTQIGFVCLWCMRLYAVNVSIPILAAAAAGRSPRALLAETLHDLRSWPRSLRAATAFFVAAVVLTAVAQRGYRSWLEEKTAREVERVMSEGGPTVPAVPQDADGSGEKGPGASEPDEDSRGSGAPGPSGREGASNSPEVARVQLAALFPLPGLLLAGAPAAPTAPAPYRLAGPLRRVSGGKGGMKAEPFDLQSRLGKGKPVALVFWAPGFHESERGLVQWARFLQASASQIEVYAVSGRRSDQKDEEIWEGFSMMEVPSELPLLVDDEFKVSNALDVADVPNVALFDRKGTLVIAKMKNRAQLLVLPPANATAEDLVRKVAAGEDVPTIQRMFPYYPASELYGRCAPPFTLKKFDATEPFTFTGRSPSGRPTMLVFWSSTCKHCQVEIPHLVAWLKEHPTNVDVVSVTHIKAEKTGEPSHRKVTEAYIKSQGISWIVLEDPDRAVEDLYGSVSTPTIYFITPDGTVTNAWFYAHEKGFDEAMTRELARITSASGSCRAYEAPPAPRMDFQVTGPDGKRVGIGSLVDKPAIVHFWATWCKPCAEELPGLLRFRDAIEKSGEARVILVSVEDEAAGPQIQNFQKVMGTDLRSYRAPKGGLADRLDLAYRVPRSYLLAPGGVVVGSRQGGQKWDDPEVGEKVRSRLKNSTIRPHA